MEFGDNDLIEHKVLADRIVASLLPVEEKLNKVCTKYVAGVNAIEKKLQEAEDYNQIAVFSKQSSRVREDLLRFLTLKDRVKKLVSRNKERSEYLGKLLSDLGIYKQDVDKKRIETIEKENIESISIEAVGLECEADGQLCYFKGILFKQKNGVLDFSDPYNKELLNSADEEIIGKLISKFPESAATVEASSLVNSKVKVSLLKQITSYVYDHAKNQNYFEINKSLGGLLSFRKEIPENLETYIVGVQNMFNVMVKNYLKDNYPSRRADIEKALKCNEKSSLIPEDRLPRQEKNAQTEDSNEMHYAQSDDIDYDSDSVSDNTKESNESEVDINLVDQDTLGLLEALGIDFSEDDDEDKD